MYGVTAGGHSVMAHIHNFLSYLYVEVMKPHEFTETELAELKHYLNGKVNTGMEGAGQNAVAHIEVQQKASVMHYTDKMGTFLKIYVTLPRYVN
jgi:DNA polymerase delta subunit 1